MSKLTYTKEELVNVCMDLASIRDLWDAIRLTETSTEAEQEFIIKNALLIAYQRGYDLKK